MPKPIIALDFDGVVHSYTTEFTFPEVIPDPPVPGAIEFIKEMRDNYEIVIFSSRCQSFRCEREIKKWLINNGLEREYVDELDVTLEKPPADIYIDDRAYCFKGEFPSKEFIKNFKPWNQGDRTKKQ